MNTIFAGAMMIVSLYAWIGTIPGIVFLILALTSKDAKKKSTYFMWSKIGFGGLGLLLILSILFAVYQVAAAFFGIK